MKSLVAHAQVCLALLMSCAAPFAGQFTVKAQPPAPPPNASDGTRTVLVFPVADKSGKNNADLDKALRKAVTDVVPAKLLDTPRKKLTEAQANAKCQNTSPDCLRAVSQQLRADILVAPSLDRGPDDLVLAILVFDGRDGKVNSVTHWQDGTKPSQETLHALPGLIRGMFPRTHATPAPAASAPPEPIAIIPPEEAPAPTAALQATATPAKPGLDWKPLIGPLSIVGAGVVLLGAGIVTGVMMRGTEDEYNDKQVRTRADAEAAADLLDTAKTEATLSKVCFGVSALAIAAGGTWLSFELFGKSKSSERELTRVTPLVSPGHVGIVLRHQGGSL